MNRKQRGVLFAFALVVALMGLNPPYHWERPGAPTANLGHHFVFDSPPERGGIPATVDTVLLLGQVLIVTLVAGSLYLAFASKSAK